MGRAALFLGGSHMIIEWESLNKEEQIKLRDAFGHYLDNLPPSCSLDMKIAHFKEWLHQRGITMDTDHVFTHKSG
jgi:hypothetical protein